MLAKDIQLLSRALLTKQKGRLFRCKMFCTEVSSCVNLMVKQRAQGGQNLILSQQTFNKSSWKGASVQSKKYELNRWDKNRGLWKSKWFRDLLQKSNCSLFFPLTEAGCCCSLYIWKEFQMAATHSSLREAAVVATFTFLFTLGVLGWRKKLLSSLKSWSVAGGSGNLTAAHSLCCW